MYINQICIFIRVYMCIYIRREREIKTSTTQMINEQTRDKLKQSRTITKTNEQLEIRKQDQEERTNIRRRENRQNERMNTRKH